MKLTIATIDKVLWDGEADAAIVPGSEGEMTLLGHHMPLITTLRAGTIIVRKGADRQAIPVSSGFIEVSTEHTTILV
jgi:F-type H+-transporting ATPase subunit epsilon